MKKSRSKGNWGEEKMKVGHLAKSTLHFSETKIDPRFVKTLNW